PLRINKTTPSSSSSSSSSSPAKSKGGSGPLSEISPSERRRNSPSWSVMAKSSPLDSSITSFTAASSRHRYWQARDPNSPSLIDAENPFEKELPLSPKRSSIENLRNQARVKNSKMFERETKNHYDPTHVPLVQRPLAGGRPLLGQVQGNAFGGHGIEGARANDGLFKGHRRGQSDTRIPQLSPSRPATLITGSVYTTNSLPTKQQTSPFKSSLSKGRFSGVGASDYDSSVLSSDDERLQDMPARPLRRHAKSVNFDNKPSVVHEYEMVTPEPSLASREGSYESADEDEDEDASFDQDTSMDRDDSFDASLEDTDKTPVVLPEDWRHMSPEAADTSLADTFEDPFDGKDTEDPSHDTSAISDGESRPLPPLPGVFGHARRRSSTGLSATAERVSSAQRSLPTTPRAAGVSKSEILSMRNSSMTLEDRLHLMGLHGSREGTPTQKDEDAIASADDKSEKTETADTEDREEALDDSEEDVSIPDGIEIPHISREAILAKVNSRKYEDFDHDDSYGDLDEYDPDVPIPSREVSSNFDTDVPETIKQEQDDDSRIDIHGIPEETVNEDVDGRPLERESSVIRHDVSATDVDKGDDGSHYSSPEPIEEETQGQAHSTDEDDGPPTPKAEDVTVPKDADDDFAEAESRKAMGLPEFSSFMSDDDFHLRLQSFLGSKKEPTPVDDQPTLEPNVDFLQRATTPPVDLELSKSFEVDEEDRPGTPDSCSSVIRHPVSDSDSQRESPELESPQRDLSDIPEPVATIKAPGGSFKTRSSSTPADMATMAAVRRQVSGEHPPPIPQRDQRRQSMTAEPEEPSLLSHVSEEPHNEAEEADIEDQKTVEPDRRQSFKMQIDIPVSDLGEDLSFDIDREFDRVVEAQKVQPIFPLPSHAHAGAADNVVAGQTFDSFTSKTNLYTPQQKGYLMRQNTKVVVASSRKFSDEVPTSPTVEKGPTLSAAPGSRSAGNSPRKPSRERSNTWTTEPWNGKSRRRSIRNASSGEVRPKTAPGPAPPLPGQESNVTGGFEEMSMIDEDVGDVERGRLFVKVLGVKDLELALPKNDRILFNLTLDNGLHCVTTSYNELGRNAPINQEFELVVLNDLEFQLTLAANMTNIKPPKQEPVRPTSPMKPPGHKKTNSTFGRFLTSPKKRKEAERRQQEEAEREAAAERTRQAEEDARKKRSKANPTAWDVLHRIVSPEGNFARAYVCLKSHEQQAFGRPYVVDIPCFNEWALEEGEQAGSSVKSKRGGVVRRPPYKVGKVQLQLLYVPTPKGAKDEDMPKSLNACIREMKEAEEIKSRVWEGHLSQQGGDCPYWRRRFFRLAGTKLTAYHESTLQPRATINLAKASKLVDDRCTLTQPSSGRSGSRRKSGFAEEDEGYAFVEEGFRIRFHNGETIDFYADNAEQKDGWMRVLTDSVGKEAPLAKPWTELVFAKEKAERAA
ncbi:DUF1709-domain-containing protein, partial [Saccharata proteae CBS 121410]